MNEHDKNFIKWLLAGLLMFVAIAVMYYQHRPKEQAPQVEIKHYQMRVKPLAD